MSLANDGFGGNVLGRATASAGTVINHLVPPKPGAISRVSTLKGTCGVTAHTVTALRAIGNTTASAAAAISQAVVNLTADPGPSGNGIAANDIVAIRHAVDGVTRQYVVSSVSTLAITMTTNFTVAVTARDKVWDFGVIGDTDPKTGTAHPTLPLAASATTTHTDTVGGVVAGGGKDEPIILQSNNATNAGSLDYTAFSFTHN